MEGKDVWGCCLISRSEWKFDVIVKRERGE